MKKLLAVILSLCLIISCFALLGVSKNYTPKVSIEEFSAELCEMNRKYKNEPVGNRLIVKSKRDIAALNSVDIVEGYEDLHIVQFDNSESADEALEYYSDSKLVEYAEPDIPMTACDFDYNSHLSWGSDSIGIDDYFGYLEDIDNLPEIVVGVIDTGIELDHDFLKDRIIQTGINYSDSGDSNSENDDNGHGTHCAGIIVDNTLDNVKIEGYKVLNNEGSGNTTSIISAIYSAIENDVDVISMSLGGRGTSSAMQDAVNEAIKNNITVCAAAGNEGADASNCVPANLDGVITVAVHNVEDEVPYWSNWGDVVDVIAPGVDIESSYIGNTYTNLSGTSMATPFVAAASASLKSYNQNYNTEDILNIINDNSRSYNGISERFKNKPILYLGKIDGYKERTSSPVFITEPGVYENSINVELYCEDINASIYYTTDGSRPAYNNSTLYTEPFTVSNCSVVRAYAISENKYKSPIIKAEYDIVTEDDESNFTINEEGVITAYNGNNNYLRIPNTIKNKTVTGLGYRLFLERELRIIKIPDTVTTIGESAFAGCKYLTNIDLNNVNSIGKRAFRHCTSLEKVTSNTNYSVDETAFAYCNKLVYIDTTKLKNTAKDLFYECRSLTEFINENVTEIADHCFYFCKGLMYVDIPNVTELSQYAFSNCGCLEMVEAPNLKTANSFAFMDCFVLKELDFPKLESVIGQSNFFRCKNLLKVNLPKLSGKLSKNCFYYVRTPVIQLDNITDIGSSSFSNCKTEKIILKNAVSLSNQSFLRATCSVLYIPKVKSALNDRCFENCESKVVFAPSLTESKTLPLSQEGTTIYLSDKYQNSLWTGFKNCTIIAPIGSYAETFSKENCENAVFIDSDTLINHIATYQAKEKTHYDFCLDGIGEILSVADDVNCSFISDGEEFEAEAGNRNGDSLYLSFSSSENISSLRAKINIDGMVFMSPELTEFDNVKAADSLPDNDCGHNWELKYFADGISVFNCAECNESYYVSYISQLRHNDNLIDMNSDGKVNGKDYHYLMRDYSAYSVSV